VAKLKKYKIDGKADGEVELDDKLIKAEVSKQMIKDYLVIYRNNQRQWSASTKGKAEVKATGAKPHPQKGTGRARQGSIVSPQYKGGGIVHGPKPKFDQTVKMNKKERRAVLKALMAQRVQEGKVSVLDIDGMDAPKTKTIASFLSALSLNGQRVLFLGAGEKEPSMNMAKSTRNLQKVSMKLASNFCGYDAALNQNIILTKSAFEEMKTILERS